MSTAGLEGGVDAEVAIVGAGPTGTVLAILLAQRGHSVVVLERFPEPYPLPRAVHFDHEVGRILQSCGIGEDLREVSEPAEVYEWRNAAGEVLLRFGRIGLGASGWPESSMFNQPAVEALLEARAEAIDGVDVRRGVEVVGVAQDHDGVTISGTGADGRTVEVRARYAVACDGANSTVRRLLDIPVVDLGFFYDWLIVDVVLHEPRVFDPINLQICDPVRPTTVVSGGPGRRRWEFMRLPHESLDELDDERVGWALLEPWDVTPDNATLERHAVYTFNARYAEDWRDRRVLLAGDAAHQMPPFAGQGMCSGLRDATNLAWKLDLVLRGLAPDGTLDTYDEERRPHVEGVIGFSMELGKVICVPDPDEAAARDEAMRAGVTDEVSEVPPLPPVTGRLLGDDAVAGHLVPQARVRRGDTTGLLDDVVGVGWRLLSASAEPVVLDPEDAEWFASIGGEVVTLGPGGDVEDVDRTYGSWLDARGARAVLQRPDFLAFATATDAAGAAALVADLRARLAADPAVAPST